MEGILLVDEIKTIDLFSQSMLLEDLRTGRSDALIPVFGFLAFSVIVVYIKLVVKRNWLDKLTWTKFPLPAYF